MIHFCLRAIARLRGPATSPGPVFATPCADLPEGQSPMPVLAVHPVLVLPIESRFDCGAEMKTARNTLIPGCHSQHVIAPEDDEKSAMVRMQRQIEKLEHDNCQLLAALAKLSQKEAESSYLACHDSLTALPNRRLLMDRFEQATGHADRHREQVALLFIDLDRFKDVNDNCGHVAGDRVLQIVATRIRAAIRATDTACRYGGDEFVVMLTELKSAVLADDLADKIRLHLGRPYEVDAVVVDLNASIGIATYPDDGRILENLIIHAGAAMRRAKRK